MAKSKMARAIEIGLNLPISKASLKWIKKQDPDLYKQIRAHQKKRGLKALAKEEYSNNG